MFKFIMGVAVGVIFHRFITESVDSFLNPTQEQ